MDAKEINIRTGRILDSALRVHSALGPGLLESAYEACLAYELRERGSTVVTQVELPVVYKGIRIGHGYRVDMLVDDVIIVELKTVKKILPVHDAQLLSYLKLSDRPVGLLINFHSQHLRDGIKRLVNKFPE